jgi:hypothetical protein
MDMVEPEFLEQQEIKPWVWLRYIDDIFFVWLEGEDKLLQFMKRLNEFHPSLKFTYELQVFFVSLPIAINNYIMSHHTLRTLKDLSYIVRVCASRKFAHAKRILRNTYRNCLVGLKMEHIQHGS